jgi:hypothetical protein
MFEAVARKCADNALAVRIASRRSRWRKEFLQYRVVDGRFGVDDATEQQQGAERACNLR